MNSIFTYFKRNVLRLGLLTLCIWSLRASLFSQPSDFPLPGVIVLGETPEPLELFAAEELQKYMELLFHHTPRILYTGRPETGTAAALILGQPSKFPLVRDLTQGIDWKGSDQVYALVPTNSSGNRTLVLAGASAPATLWAAYELIEKWGVRFDLDGDLLPERPSLPPWIQRAVRSSPAIPMRVLTGHNLHVEGPASWGIDDYRQFLNQAAKLRYNGYMFMLRDIGPWFDLEFRGVRKEKADIYGGGWLKEYLITPELVGYEHFKKEGRVFYNPWFRGMDTDAERMRVGPQLVQAIFEHARRRGMKTGLYFELTNLPPEMKAGFARLTGNSKNYEGIPKEELYLKAKEDVTNPVLWDLIDTKLRTIQKTYPALDFYQLGQMEHTSATVNYVPLWKDLDRKYGVGQILNLEEVFGHSDRYPVRKNFRENVTGEIEFLWLMDKIFLERGALGKIFPETSRLLVGNGVTTLEFFPILPKIWPARIQLDAWLEYGYHRAADKLDVLDSLGQHNVRAWMNNCLDEDNNLWLAQNTIEAIHKTVQKAVAVGVEGMEVGHWRVRDVAPAARYMAEACWNPKLSPEEFYTRYLTDRVGKTAAATLESAFRSLEQADRYTSVNLLGIAFCYPGRLKPYLDSPESKNETRLRNSLDLYTSSWKLFAASLEHATPAGRPMVQAWANRTDFSRRYLEMLRLTRELGLTWKRAKVSPEGRDTARRLAQQLPEHVRGMIELVATDIQDRSDQATLISLNYLLYQPALEIRAEILRDLK